MLERVKATWKKLRSARVEKTQQALGPQLLDLGNLLGLPAAAQRISARENLRDMNPLMHERMQQVCFFLAVTTPFGKRIIQIITDYVVGEGFSVAADDPDVQAVVDRFWNDPVNRMNENLESLFKELITFGELCIPVAVNPVDGFVRLGYIDPQEILEIEFGMLVTGGAAEVSIPVGVRLKAKPSEAEGRQLAIIRTDETFESKSMWQLVGDCFFIAINKAKTASRGISILFSLADWIDVFDQMVFDFADRVRFLNAFIWDYTLKGADKAAVSDYKNELLKAPPKQGGVQVHNEQVEIKATTPDLKGADMRDASNVVKRYGLGGAGLPAWMFADPEDANRATAQEMAGPTGKMFTNYQNIMKRVVGGIVDFVIDQAVAHGVLPEDVDRKYTVQVPDLSVKDIGASATALQAIANAAGVAEDRGWIRGETASRAFQSVLTQVGVESDPEEYDLAQKEKKDREAQQQDALDPQANLADALRKGKPATQVTQ
jgi:hypothetical protein